GAIAQCPIHLNQSIFRIVEVAVVTVVRRISNYIIGGWPTQAVFWFEWGSSTAGHNLPAARSRLLAIHSHSISTRPSLPVAYWRELLHSQSSAHSHKPRFTGLRWI